MGRPRKKGLDFFPLDANMFYDLKIKRLLRDCEGGKGYSVFVYFLSRIYKEGYYINWDDDWKYMASCDLKFEEEFIEKCIDCMLRVDLLNKELFDKYKILTSHGIQKQYFLIFRLNKRILPSSLPYLLIEFPQEDIKLTTEETAFPQEDIKKCEIEKDNSFPQEETEFPQEETDLNLEETEFPQEGSAQNKVKKRKDNLDSLDYPRDAREGERETKVPADVGDQKVCTSIDEEVTNLRNSLIWKEQVFMRFKFLNFDNKLLEEYLQRWGQEFIISGRSRHLNLGDAKHHFISWMIIQEDKLKKQDKTNNNNGYRSRQDMLEGTARIMAELRAEGSQLKKEIPIV